MQSTILKTVYSSTGTAFQSRGLDSSSVPSLWGVSRPQNIPGCVFISVVDRTTFRARPLPNCQRQRLQYVAACRAPFTTREESVNFLQGLPISLAFVSQHPARSSERGISKMFCQMPVADHTSHIQVLNTDDIKTPHEISCDLMQVIGSGIGSAVAGSQS